MDTPAITLGIENPKKSRFGQDFRTCVARLVHKFTNSQSFCELHVQEVHVLSKSGFGNTFFPFLGIFLAL